jgi:phage tail sheath protein FI
MPVQPTYPGVYIEEIPGGVRTITGVATSITAFIGRAVRGPADEPITINSYGDFERIFGGLWLDSTLSYAVRDFFLNGGGQAIIVRLYNPETGGGAKPANTVLSVGGITLQAAYPGTWGINLRAIVDLDVSEQVALQMGLQKADLFNLKVIDLSSGGSTELFRNVTVKESPRRIDKVLKAESNLVRWNGVLDPNTPPAIPTMDPDGKKRDVLAAAEKQLEDALRAIPRVPTDISAARALVATELLNRQNAVSDGLPLVLDSFIGSGKEAAKQGLYALENADLFNLLCIPPYLITNDVDSTLIDVGAQYCQKRRSFLIVDPPSAWRSKDIAKTNVDNLGTRSNHAAVFFPRLRQPNPLRNNQKEDFVPCGAVAGIFARTDAQRGIWKAPAGLAATLVGVPELSVGLTDPENGELNPLGINCLRARPAAGRVVWGARTLEGDDRLASEWKYIPVRRLALYIEESLYRGTQWVVFEPNDEPLWAQIRLNVGAFMHNLFRQGAFQGTTPKDAYLVKCDKETTTQNDINQGIVNILVGFAPLKPAEFVIIKLQQLAGQIDT